MKRSFVFFEKTPHSEALAGKDFQKQNALADFIIESNALPDIWGELFS